MFRHFSNTSFLPFKSGAAFADGQIYFSGGGELITQPLTATDLRLKDIALDIQYATVHKG